MKARLCLKNIRLAKGSGGLPLEEVKPEGRAEARQRQTRTCRQTAGCR